MMHPEDVCPKSCCWTPYGCAKRRGCGHHKPTPRKVEPIVAPTTKTALASRDKREKAAGK